MHSVDLERLLSACDDHSHEDGIRIDTDLEPLAGPGGTVKPPTYLGGRYQSDRRWASPSDEKPTKVIVIDNVPSQANRLEEAMRRHRDLTRVPEFVLDLSGHGHLPPHLPKRLSSLQFPHRNADAYLRDSQLAGEDFTKTELGKQIFAATAQECGPLMAWFPQALIYGFWQSHLGKKRQNTKHARAWVSEIVGWNPAETGGRTFGLKGDPLNLNVDSKIKASPDDRLEWSVGSGKVKLSEIGHGQVPVTEREAAPSAVSFARITQKATVSLAQLRRVSLGLDLVEADPAARALLVALGLHAHILAFGKGFALRSGAALRPRRTCATWLGSKRDSECSLGDARATESLLKDAKRHAESMGVPLDGWGHEPTILTPKPNLSRVISDTWPRFSD